MKKVLVFMFAALMLAGCTASPAGTTASPAAEPTAEAAAETVVPEGPEETAAGNEEETQRFREDFDAGKFTEEAEQSIAYAKKMTQ